MATREDVKNLFSLSLPDGDFLVDKSSSTARALILTELAKKGPVLLVTSGEEEALVGELQFFGTALHLPASEPDTLGARFKALQELNNGARLVVTPLQSALQKTADPVWLEVEHITLQVGQRLSFEALKKQLLHLGYKSVTTVSDTAEVAWRGGIIDCFATNASAPFRIEFVGSSIESLRSFDPISQKSLARLDQVLIMPAKEECASSLLDYFPRDVTVAFDDLVALEDRLITLGQINHAFSFQEFIKACPRKVFFAKETITEIADVPMRGVFSWCNESFKVEHFSPPFIALELHEPILPTLAEDKEMSYYFVCQSASDEALIKTKIAEEAPSLQAFFSRGQLTSGLVAPGHLVTLIPGFLLTERRMIGRKAERVFAHTTASDLLHLQSGDLVVHFHHGIGKYLGVDRKANNLGIESEFLHIEFAKGARLFLPLDKAYLLTKYVGSDEKSVDLHELGTSRWQKQRAKTEASINTYAKELVALYAARKMPRTNACQADGELMRRFDGEFPYELTEDQDLAIKAVKEDLTSPYAMDRLVCGDVGFGKTEVAMRAAFKAVADGGKQVVILAPTTLLVLQHFETFSHRMAGFPLKIGHLSRFVSAKEQKATIEKLATGEVDIIVATHRILSRDIIFKNLGLVIIDEEQRFGVKAKEHLKAWKKDVDCLTLSATPIPRTLYLSLSGTRDMSLINTPPYDRLPIKTVIAEKEDETIKSALLRERARAGQAFFIHNRVETIWEARKALAELLPEAVITVVHAQMDSDEIDNIFHAFKKGEIHILVATTLVENGIDIPNANTILIDRADHFGLSELHQLRGRVGRWNKRAYCYFLIPPRKTLSQMAYKRLEALAESAGWGGGMKIAMRDLEIRGAGNILGTEQSGQVSTIGFHLYCKLLKRQVDALQGKSSLDLPETRLELKIDARLPEDYVNAIELRMEFYQRTSEATSFEEIEALFAEMIDRFGPLPEPAAWLKTLSRIRLAAALQHLTLIKQLQTSLHIEGKSGSRTLLFSFPKSPALYEEALLQAINKN